MPIYPIFEFPLLREYYLNIVSDAARSVKGTDHMRVDQRVIYGKGLVVVLNGLNGKVSGK